MTSLSRFIAILVILGCVLFASTASEAVARSGGSSSSTTGSSQASTGHAQAPNAAESAFGGGTGQGRGLRGGISNAPSAGGSASPASSVSFPTAVEPGGAFSSPQFTGGEDTGISNLQSSLYSDISPLEYGGQSTSPYGYGSTVGSIYSGGYGGTTTQAPVSGSSSSIQALGQPAAGGSCMSTCTETYTPFECSKMYCSEKKTGGGAQE